LDGAVTAAPDVAMVARPVASLRHGAAAAPALLGEGPVWDAALGELVWVDIERGLVHRRRSGGAEVSFDVRQPVGCAVPRAAGGLALALRDGFALLPAAGGPPRLVAPAEAQRSDTRMNDGGCDSRGRFWAGTMSLAGDTRTAALYRLDSDLTVTRVLPGLSISNGLGWSPDDQLMYHVDTPRGRIDVYEFEALSGAIGGRRAAIAVSPDEGRPDGLAVDAEGGIWVALWGGGAVQRHSAEGRLEAQVELPVTQVTNCCFGDSDLGTLYVTSASRGAEHEPLAGSLFACRPGVRGLPATPFAG
jgi:sugar lactone lactonase YvrE